MHWDYDRNTSRLLSEETLEVSETPPSSHDAHIVTNQFSCATMK